MSTCIHARVRVRVCVCVCVCVYIYIYIKVGLHTKAPIMFVYSAVQLLSIWHAHVRMDLVCLFLSFWACFVNDLHVCLFLSFWACFVDDLHVCLFLSFWACFVDDLHVCLFLSFWACFVDDLHVCLFLKFSWFRVLTSMSSCGDCSVSASEFKASLCLNLSVVWNWIKVSFMFESEFADSRANKKCLVLLLQR